MVSTALESRDLSRRECLAHLRDSTAGRLVFSLNCLPAARPVRVDMIDDLLLVVLGPEIDPQAVRTGDVVALEIDDSSPSAAASWSVSATGQVLRCFDDELAEPPSSRLSWAPAAGLPLLVLSIERIEGHGLDPRSSA